MADNTVKTDVLILGGGIAGLAAALSLHHQGVRDYVIVEGDSRLGGRIHTVTSPQGHVLEYGAGWIHSVDSNPIYDLAKSIHLESRETLYDEVAAYNNGANVSVTVNPLFSKLYEAQGKLKQMIKCKKANPEEQDISQHKGLQVSGWMAMTPEERVVEYIIYDFCYGMDNSEISLRFSLDYDPDHPDDCATHDVRVTDRRGYAYLIKCMSDQLDHQRIFLNEIVNSIDYCDTLVTARTSRATYIAKYAILTFSIGVLQNNEVSFQPPLPVEKVKVINALKMTNYIKVFIAFDETVEPFWDANEIILNCSDRLHHFTVWENMRIIGYNMLIGVLMEEEADRVAAMTDEQIKQEAMNILHNMYGPNIPQPSWVTMTRWATNPLHHGCFTGRPVGVTVQDIQTLGEPLGRMYFAGEAYPAFSYGDVCSAYGSGQEVGDTVANELMTQPRL